MSDALDEMLTGYVACALWITNDESDESGGVPIDCNYSTEDIDPETLRKMRDDCRAFLDANREDIDTIKGKSYPEGYASGYGRAGHDLWLTRNGHGTGFWDRDDLAEEVAKRLTDAAHAFGEVNPYVGDDKQIYI